MSNVDATSSSLGWQAGRQAAARLMAWQCLLTGGLATLCGLFLNGHAGGSALLGGMIGVFGTWLFARLMFLRRTLSPRGMLLAMCLGAAGKMLWTVVAFLLAFWLLDLHALACLAAYAAALSANWLALLPLPTRPARRCEGDESATEDELLPLPARPARRWGHF